MSFILTLIFLKNMVISTLGKRLSCRHRSRKEKARKTAKSEKQNCIGLANYTSLLKKTLWAVTNKLASNHIKSGMMYRTAVIIRKISPFRMNQTCRDTFPDNDRRSIHYPLLETVGQKKFEKTQVSLQRLMS